MTLADRINWILLNRARPDGRPWKPTPLSQAAGLGRNHVAQILTGSVKDPDTATLEAIAATTGVSAAWLIVGAGSPDDETPAASHSTPLRFGELPAWKELLAGAKLRHPSFPAWVWERTARSFPLDGATPNAAAVAYAAQGILDQTLPPESRTNT